MSDKRVRHGHSTRKGCSRTYKSWRAMCKRCTEKTSKDYAKYGALGIDVCVEWLYDFKNFLKDMGEMPEDKQCIDRIDRTKGYYKKNCRWATFSENSMNRPAYKKSTSKYKGVSKRKDRRHFYATIKVKGTNIYLGSFLNEKEAALAYNEAAKKYHGEFATLNKV